MSVRLVNPEEVSHGNWQKDLHWQPIKGLCVVCKSGRVEGAGDFIRCLECEAVEIVGPRPPVEWVGFRPVGPAHDIEGEAAFYRALLAKYIGWVAYVHGVTTETAGDGVMWYPHPHITDALANLQGLFTPAELAELRRLASEEK